MYLLLSKYNTVIYLTYQYICPIIVMYFVAVAVAIASTTQL